MGELLVQVLTKNAEDAARLRAQVARKNLLTDVAGEEKRIADVPGDFETHNALGVAYVQLGRVPDALDQFRTALTLAPDHAQAAYNIGVIAMGQKRMSDAIVSFEQAIAARPDYAEAHNNLGVAFEAAGRDDDAARQFRAALSAVPSHAAAHNNLGRLLLTRGSVVGGGVAVSLRAAQRAPTIRMRCTTSDARSSRSATRRRRCRCGVGRSRRVQTACAVLVDTAWLLATNAYGAERGRGGDVCGESESGVRRRNPVRARCAGHGVCVARTDGPCRADGSACVSARAGDEKRSAGRRNPSAARNVSGGRGPGGVVGSGSLKRTPALVLGPWTLGPPLLQKLRTKAKDKAVQSQVMRRVLFTLLALDVCRPARGGSRGAPAGSRQPAARSLSRRRRQQCDRLSVRSVDCPISNRYAPVVQRLYQTFSPQGVTFWLIYPNPAETPAAIRDHVKAFNYPVHALRDPKHELVKLTNVQVTPEVAVFDRSRALVYHGRIDDRYVSLGVERPAPTRQDLADALTATLSGIARQGRRDASGRMLYCRFRSVTDRSIREDETLRGPVRAPRRLEQH